MNTSYEIGLIFGFAAVVVLLVISRKVKNRNRMSHYDERQKQIQAKGLKLGYLSMYFMLFFIIVILELGADILFSAGMWVFVAMMVSVTVSGVYNIFHDAYIEFDKRGNNYLALYALIAALNLFPGIQRYIQGKLFESGVITLFSGANLVCGIVFLILTAAIVIRRAMMRAEAEE